MESWDPIKQKISVSGAGQPPTCLDARAASPDAGLLGQRCTPESSSPSSYRSAESVLPLKFSFALVSFCAQGGCSTRKGVSVSKTCFALLLAVNCPLATLCYLPLFMRAR